MRAPLATRSNTEGGGSSASKDLLVRVKAAAADKGVSEMKEVRLCSFCTARRRQSWLSDLRTTRPERARVSFRSSCGW
jgi:ribosome modulation factor|eukprot:COSAG06_NODE_673_length_13189_cov_211.299312_9_plen_78_part_00